MDLRGEAQKILEFHEAKQKEHGQSKRGRPDGIAGKKGWGIRDTAKALGRPYKTVQRLVKMAIISRGHNSSDPNVTSSIDSGSVRKARLENFLAHVRTTIFILKKDKRTVKIGTDLEKALEDYEN